VLEKRKLSGTVKESFRDSGIYYGAAVVSFGQGVALVFSSRGDLEDLTPHGLMVAGLAMILVGVLMGWLSSWFYKRGEEAVLQVEKNLADIRGGFETITSRHAVHRETLEKVLETLEKGSLPELEKALEEMRG
jgi:hypothetical protein